MVSLVTLISFWKKKESEGHPEPERVIPLPDLPPSTLQAPRSTSAESVKEAREALKLLKLERQILGSAVTTIYDSQLKGVITEAERDRMLEKYKVDLKDLEKRIEVNQQVVDLYDLEIEREDATRNYKAKLAEIDARLKDLKSGTPSKTHNPTEAIERTSQLSDDKSAHHNEAERQPSSAPEEKHKEEEEISDAEKRVEKIRAEILQAMDRLEQIEAEG